MEEGIFCMPYIHKRGIESGCYFFNTAQVDVPYGEAVVAFFGNELYEATILKESQLCVGPACLNDEFGPHQRLALFVTVLAKTLFALVGGHLMALSFLSAWHS
jgi:hypothetical protein